MAAQEKRRDWRCQGLDILRGDFQKKQRPPHQRGGGSGSCVCGAIKPLGGQKKHVSFLARAPQGRGERVQGLRKEGRSHVAEIRPMTSFR